MVDSDDKVESTDWKKDCLAWRNKAKNMELRIHQLEKELRFERGLAAGLKTVIGSFNG
jgi:hypothetical protein